MFTCMKHYDGSVYGLNTVSPKCVKTMGCHVNMHTSQRTVPGPYQGLNVYFL